MTVYFSQGRLVLVCGRVDSAATAVVALLLAVFSRQLFGPQFMNSLFLFNRIVARRNDVRGRGLMYLSAQLITGFFEVWSGHGKLHGLGSRLEMAESSVGTAVVHDLDILVVADA